MEFEVPDGHTEIERYWVDEPYTFISILDDTKMLHYQVVEPSLTTYEKEILERVYEDLQDVLTLKDTSKAGKNAVLTDKTLSLFKRYHALLDVASMHRIIYYLRRNFRGYEKINPLLLVLLCHITDKSTACGGMTSNRLENKTNIKRLNEWLI